MAKTTTRGPAAEKEKLEAQRKERAIEKAESTEDDLEEALEESFPASDPPSMTQPETEVGSPSKDRKSNSKR
ncbi:MAG TPA: hypothetical protein VKV77_01855 [Methylovirgula sp.]|nr:hypothetical protein [Methylovirgula sp.]